MLVVLTGHIPDRAAADSLIADISRMVYQHATRATGTRAATR